MDTKEIDEQSNRANQSVIFVCKHCGDLFWSYEERNKHREICEYKKIIPFKN